MNTSQRRVSADTDQIQQERQTWLDSHAEEGLRREMTMQPSEVTSRTMTRDDGTEQKVYTFTGSSDTPYRMWSWGNDKYEEVLLHGEENVDLDRMNDGGQLLFNHNRDDYIGVCVGARTDGSRTHFDVVFADTEQAEQTRRNVEAGILRNVSIGYRIHDELYSAQEMDDGEVIHTWTVSRFEILEVSIVTVPADQTVGFGRQLRALTKKTGAPTMPEPIIKDTNEKELETLRADIKGLTVRLDEMREQDEARAAELEAQRGEAERQRAIREACRGFEALPADRRHALLTEALDNESHTVETFTEKAREALDEIAKEDAGSLNMLSKIGITRKEAENFNLGRLILAMDALEGQDEKLRKSEKDVMCLELECANEIAARKAGGDAPVRMSLDGKSQLRGFAVPWEVLNSPALLMGARQEIARKQRAVGTGDSSGGDLIETVHQDQNFIDTLRDVAVTMRLCRLLPGLVGNVEIPRLTNNVTFSMIAEDANTPQNDVAFDNITLSPHTGAGSVPITRRLLQQSTPNAQSILLGNITYGVGLLIDEQVLSGDGTGQNVRGVTSITGVNAMTWDDSSNDQPTIAEIANVSRLLDDDNALMGNLAWITSPSMYHKLRTTQKFASSNGVPILMDGMLDGHPVYKKSSVVGEKQFLFANWDEVNVGFWEMLELVIDRATGIAAGRVQLRAFTDLDMAASHPVSIANVTDAA